MFNPVPGNNDDKTQFSEKPLLNVKPTGQASNASHTQDSEALFNYVLDCLDHGSSKADIRKQLIAMGYSATDAETSVEEVAEWRRKNPDNLNVAKYPPAPVIANTTPTGFGSGGANSNMVIGGVICLLGLVVTIGTCLAAGERGGTVTIAWGAIVFGGIQFFRGVSQQRD
jgi:hypothetical protein